MEIIKSGIDEVIKNKSKKEENLANMTKLYLEASINKKVENPTIKFFKDEFEFKNIQVKYEIIKNKVSSFLQSLAMRSRNS
jgi:hypothetical protein